MSHIVILDRELPTNCYMCSFRSQGYIFKYHCPIIKKDFTDEYIMRNGGNKHRLCEDKMLDIEDYSD